MQTGKMKHVGLLLEFFNALIERIDREQAEQLVGLCEAYFQSRADKARLEMSLAIGSPAPQEGPSAISLVQRMFDGSSLVITLMQATVDVMPRIVSAMSNLEHEEFQELDIDEGSTVALTVFGRNYSFFSQNLPKMLQGFLTLAKRKADGK